MLVCLPYHTDLPVDYAGLAQSIMKAGTNPSHTLAIISLRSQDEGAFTLANALFDYFGRTIRHSIDEQPETTVMTSNRFFNAALNVFDKYKPSPHEAEHSPMMYLDPTYRPITPRWLDEIQSDYFRSGAPRVFGNFSEGAAPHPVGPIILSREYQQVSTLADFLPHDMHWRRYLSWELLRNSVKAAGIGEHASAVLAPYYEI